MTGKEMRDRLHSGDRVYGTMVVAFSPRWPAAVKGIGLDFAFIETEHVPQNRAELSWMCHAYSAAGVVPVVRVPSPDPYRACMALDGGARGVIAPYVETVEQTRQIVGAVKYRPVKGAKLSQAMDGSVPFEPELRDQLDRQNADNVAIVNIESVPAMDALDDILSVKGLDAVLIGPNDLTYNLGIPNQYSHPRFIEAVDTIIAKARDHNVGAGIHIVYADGAEPEIRWAKMGANLIVHSMDVVAFRAQLRQEFDAIKAAIGDDR